jgi:hypothetical protein
VPWEHNLSQLLTLSVVPILLPKETDAAVLKSKFKTRGKVRWGMSSLAAAQPDTLPKMPTWPGVQDKVTVLEPRWTGV